MKEQVDIKHGQYSSIEYRMFNLTAFQKFLKKIFGWLSIPFIYPLILLAKIAPETGFRTASELLSLVPFLFGIIIRYEFYRCTLRRCGENVCIGFGTVFYYPQVVLGNNLLIGMYNTVHHCDFGDNVLVADGCHFLSGSKYHHFYKISVPINQQGGSLKRICIGDDVWIGANSIIMDDVGNGSVVGAGSVVTDEIEPYSVVAGNPARFIKKRE